MRHSIFADNATCAPGIPWEILARTARATRSEGVRFRDYGFLRIDPAPEKPRVPRSSSSAPKLKIRRIFGEHFLLAAIIAAIILVSMLLLAGGNLLADSLITRLRAAEQQRIDQGWKEELAARAPYAPWIDAHPGQWYTIKWGDREMRIRSKGTLRKLSELPKEGNQIGDFYNIEGQTHFFVWMVSDHASTPSWVDP